MTLELRDTTDAKVCVMNDDTEKLAAYGAQQNYTIHVIDASGTTQTNEFEDVSRVEKYNISEEAYGKRDDTFRKFKDDQMKHNPAFKAAVESKKIPVDF